LGRILETHYNTRELVEELINGGDMSTCWGNSNWDDDTKPAKYSPRYYAARGEHCPPRLDKDIEEFLSHGEEYSYIFRNGYWFTYAMHQFEDMVVAIPVGPLAVMGW